MMFRKTTDPKVKNARIAALSGYVGSTLEYYDFFIYGSAAALVFDRIIFNSNDPAIATLLSIASVGVAYVTRPLGAILFGHLGDSIGRKKTLLIVLLLMGISTFLIGLMPVYEQVGVWAPILMVLLRLLQGLSAGGESPGSSALTMESAPHGRRGFFTSWTISGVTSGIVLANLVFIPVAALPDEVLLGWAWRVPFLFSAVVVVIALILRLFLKEPEVFVETKAQDQVVKAPAVVLFRDWWGTMIRVVLMSLFTAVTSVFNIFVLSYATADSTYAAMGEEGLPRTMMLWVIVVANGVSAALTPVFGWLSDKVGRKPVFITGMVGAVVMSMLFFDAIGTRNVTGIWITSILLVGFVYTMTNAVYPAYFPEQFPVAVRYSGMAISLMVGLIVTGFAPTVAQTLVAGDPTNWIGVALFVAGICAVSGIACVASPETFRLRADQLGATRAELSHASKQAAVEYKLRKTGVVPTVDETSD